MPFDGDERDWERRRTAVSSWSAWLLAHFGIALYAFAAVLLGTVLGAGVATTAGHAAFWLP